MMSDLISRAAAIAEIEEYLQGLNSCISEPDLKLDGYRNGLQVAIHELNELPTIDAVPVVRCKDCRWWDTGDDKYHYCFCHITLRYVPGDLYCADGERRGGNEGD